jgi:hypothetical protein
MNCIEGSCRVAALFNSRVVQINRAKIINRRRRKRQKKKTL